MGNVCQKLKSGEKNYDEWNEMETVKRSEKSGGQVRAKKESY
jgi:hypothetical protein